MTDTVVTDNDNVAMYADGPQVTILRCVIARNNAGSGNPAGLMVHTPALTIEDCLFVDNRNDWWAESPVSLSRPAPVRSRAVRWQETTSRVRTLRFASSIQTSISAGSS